MTRRTTYKIVRISAIGKLTILETNDKHEFFQLQDQLITDRGADSLVKCTTKTATFKY